MTPESHTRLSERNLREQSALPEASDRDRRLVRRTQLSIKATKEAGGSHRKADANIESWAKSSASFRETPTILALPNRSSDKPDSLWKRFRSLLFNAKKRETQVELDREIQHGEVKREIATQTQQYDILLARQQLPINLQVKGKTVCAAVPRVRRNANQSHAAKHLEAPSVSKENLLNEILIEDRQRRRKKRLLKSHLRNNISTHLNQQLQQQHCHQTLRCHQAYRDPDTDERTTATHASTRGEAVASETSSEKIFAFEHAWASKAQRDKQDAIFGACRVHPKSTLYKKVATEPGNELRLLTVPRNIRTPGSRMIYDIGRENSRHHKDCNRDFARAQLKKICPSYCRPVQFRYVY